jgi:1,4-dihydroxy-2-naphthoate polyprenyltransferase
VTSSPLVPNSPLGTSSPGPAGAHAGSLRAWVLACRPATLSAAAVPVLVGSAVAHVQGGVRWGPALAALVGALLLQIGANLANDVFDYEKGADTAERLGPLRTVQAGLLSARAVRRAMVLVFALALLVGVYLTSVAGVSIVVIGLCSIAAAVAYTGGPYPLGYHGLGDVFVMLFFGFVAVCGTAFVQLGTVPALALWASIPVGALATAILVVNNVRDRQTDALAGKRTLAVRLGKTGGIAEYALLISAAHLVPVALLVTHQAGAWVLLPAITVLPAALLVRQVGRNEGRALNPTLVNTAKLLMVFGVLFAAGLALGGPP